MTFTRSDFISTPQKPDDVKLQVKQAAIRAGTLIMKYNVVEMNFKGIGPEVRAVITEMPKADVVLNITTIYDLPKSC